MLCQYLQDPLDYSFMFLFHPHKDQNVVQVHYYNSFGYKGSKDVVHYSLEDSRTISYSKEYHKRFKETAIGIEDYFLFISGLDAYIVETLVDIKFCEVPGSAELGDEFRDEGGRVSILDSYNVQHVIVLDQLEKTIFLLNKEHRDCYGGLERSDSSGTQVFL